MITLSLILTDVLTPLMFGFIYLFFFSSTQISNISIFLFLLFGLTIVFVSFIRNYYVQYFATNFCDKIRISVKTSIIAIFFQLIAYIYYQLSFDIIIIIIWMLIPLTILLIRYLIRANFKQLNDTSIYIVGDYYKFNKHEIRMLKEKGFIIYFYESYEMLMKNISNKKNEKDFITIVNLSKSQLVKLRKKEPSLDFLDYIELEEFMERFLRKLYLSPEYKSFNIKTFGNSSYFIKRVFDYTAVTLLLPLVLLFIVLIFFTKIFLNIREPLFFTQQRYGKNDNLFTLYKFRTMHTGAENEGNTEVNDSRIYSFARVLREYRIDEFPQIFNILIGNMHLVGPRAEWFKLSDKYNNNINHYKLRHVVKPGITGWAQIVYPYGFNEEDAKQKLMYDLYYIKNWTVWLELEICFKTVLVILDKRGF